jgi:hypothetical protein
LEGGKVPVLRKERRSAHAGLAVVRAEAMAVTFLVMPVRLDRVEPEDLAEIQGQDGGPLAAAVARGPLVLTEAKVQRL